MAAEPNCAICLEDVPADSLARLPCCTLPLTSTTQFCARCIQIVCERGPGGVGRCPNCRQYLRVGPGGELVIADHTDTCTMCNQVRVIVEVRFHANLCEACLFGVQHTLRYECDGCMRLQRIPHPMWRYQATPVEFGNVTWYCHQRCNAFTHWRVAAQDAGMVPAQDAPETWGRREEWLASVREQRLREHHAPALQPQGRAQRRNELFTLLAAIGLLVAAGAEDFSFIRLLALGAVGALYLWSRQ